MNTLKRGASQQVFFTTFAAKELIALSKFMVIRAVLMGTTWRSDSHGRISATPAFDCLETRALSAWGVAQGAGAIQGAAVVHPEQCLDAAMPLLLCGCCVRFGSRVPPVDPVGSLSAPHPAVAKAAPGSGSAGRTPSPPVRPIHRQAAKVRIDGKKRPEAGNLSGEQLVHGGHSQVMSQLNALWQKVEELEDKVERERSQKEELRSEKEELRRENQQLQHRQSLVDPAAHGASSVPLEDCGRRELERRVSDVTPIVAFDFSDLQLEQLDAPIAGAVPLSRPSPPKSLNAFRQVGNGSCAVLVSSGSVTTFQGVDHLSWLTFVSAMFQVGLLVEGGL
eukprot:Skav221457  [mRNA]  locus=scaffold1700:235080:240824:- [translate_table: standard]